MKMYRLMKLGLCTFRSLLLPALLISYTHLVEGEILEYQIQIDEEKIKSSFSNIENRDWKLVDNVSLNKDQTLKVRSDQGIIRSIGRGYLYWTV